MGNCSTCSGRMCPKVSGYSPEHDLFDDPHSCDPAGAIFRQTLEDLNEVDRLLLLFCSSPNLAAVRWSRVKRQSSWTWTWKWKRKWLRKWLFVLGASRDACDTNGTTCLHAACRSGSLGVVRDLIARGLPVNTGDISGWTALHIAAFMGRRSVAVELMQNGAELKRRSLKGLAPADLCSDAWLQEAIFSCNAHREQNGKDSDWQFGKENDLVEDIQVTSRLRFEPFFVPRSPAVRDTARLPHLQRLGIKIFNQRPGQGLAFLVATGAVRDFPIELSTFLLENKVSRAQVGEFLGEDFSLSQTLRLEFVNSVRLTGTGVVSSLTKVFKQVNIPTDMQKIDRLLEGVAQIWWRQHERAKDYPQSLGDKDPEEGEYEGARLMKVLANYGVLHQLMFSAILLHWSLYAPMPPSQHILMKQWLEMNEGFGGKDGADKSDVQRMHKLIYTTVSSAFIPQLQIWNSQTQGSIGKLPAVPGNGSLEPKVEENGFVPSEEVNEEVLEGWGKLVGGGFPAAAGAGSVGSTVTYRHLRNIHCETTSADLSRVASRVQSRLDSMDSMPPAPAPPGVENVPHSVTHRYAAASAEKTSAKNSNGADGGGTGRVWLVLRNSLLLFAASPRNWAPYAFVYLSQLIIHSVEPQERIISLEQQKQASRKDSGDKAAGGGKPGKAKEMAEQSSQIQVVFLLPDGRWQAIEIPRLEIQLSGDDELNRWKTSLATYCCPAESTSEAPLPEQEV